MEKMEGKIALILVRINEVHLRFFIDKGHDKNIEWLRVAQIKSFEEEEEKRNISFSFQTRVAHSCLSSFGKKNEKSVAVNRFILIF